MPIDTFVANAGKDMRAVTKLPAGRWTRITAKIDDEAFGRAYVWNRMSFVGDSANGAAFVIGDVQLLFEEEALLSAIEPLAAPGMRVSWTHDPPVRTLKPTKTNQPEDDSASETATASDNDEPLVMVDSQPQQKRRRKKKKPIQKKEEEEEVVTSNDSASERQVKPTLKRFDPSDMMRAAMSPEERHHLDITQSLLDAQFQSPMPPHMSSSMAPPSSTQPGHNHHNNEQQQQQQQQQSFTSSAHTLGLPASSRVMYDGASGLGTGIEDWSWDSQIVMHYAGLQDGSSPIQVNAAPYGALSLHVDGASILDDFDTLSFWIKTSEPLMRPEYFDNQFLDAAEIQARSSLQLRFDGDETKLDALSVPLTSIVPLMQVGQWTHVLFPLRRLRALLLDADLVPTLDRISFQEMTGMGTQFYVDGIALVRRSGGSSDVTSPMCPNDLFLCQSSGRWVTRSEPFCVFLCDSTNIMAMANNTEVRMHHHHN